MYSLIIVWVMIASGVGGQEEGFISHVAKNIQAARDPFFQAKQMAELETVFAFGEKFNFNEKQIDLNEFYGNSESEEDNKENQNDELRLKKNGDGISSEQTERSGLKGWFDSFDFGDRNYFNSRQQPQSPKSEEAPVSKISEKETYDKEVKNESRRRVFANFRSSTEKPNVNSLKSETRGSSFLQKVQKWKIATRKPIVVKTDKLAEETGGEEVRAVMRRPNLKSSWGEDPIVSQRWREEDKDQTELNSLKEFNQDPSTTNRKKAPMRNKRKRTKVKKVSQEQKQRWSAPLLKTGGDWNIEVNTEEVLTLALSTPSPPPTATDSYAEKAARTKEDWEEYFRRQDQTWDKQYLQTLGEEAALPSNPPTFPTYPTSPPPPQFDPPLPLPSTPTIPLSNLLLTPKLTESEEEEGRMLRYLVKVCLTTTSKDIIKLCRNRAVNLAKKAAGKLKPTEKPKKLRVNPQRRQQSRPGSFLGGLVSSFLSPFRRILSVASAASQRANRPTKRRRVGEGSRRSEEDIQSTILDSNVEYDEDSEDVEDSIFSDSRLAQSSTLTKSDRILQLVPTRYY